jgi:hypothetical protein
MLTIAASTATFNNTASSTGTCPADWRRWWRQQSIAAHADWASLLLQHGRVFQKLCERHGLRHDGR